MRLTVIPKLMTITVMKVIMEAIANLCCVLTELSAPLCTPVLHSLNPTALGHNPLLYTKLRLTCLRSSFN